MISRRFLLTALVGAFLGLASGSVASAEADPKAFVTQLAAKAMETMTAKGIPDAERAQRFRTQFTTDVDLAEIGKFVLGRHWRAATPEQQQEFLKAFEDIVVLTWATRFKDYGGDLRHLVTNAAADGERGVVVDSKVERDHQTPINLQWKLKKGEQDFRVVDLVVEGASMAITYRNEYSSVIQSNGGKVDGLLNALRTKIAEMQSFNKDATKSN
ncbi:ABC-type transport system involved in resistance to organic solvents auxiliary component [Paramagnetospirillum magnetotacticum MS-1]|uniref:ABC-type transport system involved in resistance to organic solvents auxiliary component n=1 Tax=Paramagnetospirillum magnetotacticum MS-1 TaxID=272627 RepID=A0A0C2U7G3_PARME|nr:ABC transporter substrate-binding protein [Paramagnetospirillum magnetotacticum]KIL97412.1 ABC-type transport system involved in resistance to organic solvents auxiliary component [Paramagnetospirillum magnetotacticum MS-1]